MATQKTTNANKPAGESARAEKPAPAGESARAEKPAPAIKAVPQRVTTSRDQLIERKKLAGSGRREAPGTAFGSRWTQEERDELQALIDELGREQAVAQFIEKHPHRTANGVIYQIDRHLKKSAK